MKRRNASDVDSVIDKIEKILDEREKRQSENNEYDEIPEGDSEYQENDGEKTIEHVIEMLTVALADEWLSMYQYWVCRNLIRGAGRGDAIDEFKEHEEDELEHANDIMERLKQLGAKPITNPCDWIEIANPWTEVVTSDAKQQLNITIEAEQTAIDYYNEIIDYCRGFDEVTMKIMRSILADEEEHKYDLKMLLEEL